MSSAFFRPALFGLILLGTASGCDNSVDQVIPDPEATPAGWSRRWARPGFCSIRAGMRLTSARSA